ncbi:MraY family glycosyltransferase [Clostridium paraputrificum]|uniref:MraY family glycosyltransferase n=1 Tax=Clostridium TaxID=1485 RepID=UPI003D32FEF9
MRNYILALGVTFLIVYIITPQLMKLAKKIGFTDKPTERKKHRGPIPLCGGVGIYIGFFLMYFLLVHDNKTEQFWIFIASTLILIIGLIDDHYKAVGKEFPIYPRLIVQIFAAILVYRSGIVFGGFANPFVNGEYINLPPELQFILTITWIFGVTTVINWSDGMDGLAGGISVVSAVTFFFAAVILGQTESATTALILGAAIFGFLMYNRYPAKVFMGDSGANLIGFLLSIIAIDGAFKQATVMSLFIPILALAVPIFDNIFVIFKRFSEGKPVYQADRSQMHYRLEEKGLTTKQIVNYIVVISLVCSIISILLLLIKH